jgi:hypothetical protein
VDCVVAFFGVRAASGKAFDAKATQAVADLSAGISVPYKALKRNGTIRALRAITEP